MKEKEEAFLKLENFKKLRSADFEKLKALLNNLSTSQQPNQPFSHLLTSAIDSLVNPLEQCLQQDLAMLNDRLSHAQALLRKLKLNQSKLVMERDFYKERSNMRHQYNHSLTS